MITTLSQQFFAELTSHFFSVEALTRVEAMIAAESNVEGWFKAEIFVILNKMKHSGLIRQWEREAKFPPMRGALDFHLTSADRELAVENKTAYLGFQKESKWRLRDNADAITTDVKKLSQLDRPNTDRLVLIFSYPAQDQKEWGLLVSKIRHDCPNIRITEDYQARAHNMSLDIRLFGISTPSPA